jgi:hypothetical protein
MFGEGKDLGVVITSHLTWDNAQTTATRWMLQQRKREQLHKDGLVTL